MKWYVAALSALLCTLNGAQAQTQRALLIGINTYQPQGTEAQHAAGCIYGRCELGRFENLEGAVNDAQAMADLLTSPKFGFPAKQVVLLTNPAPVRPRAGVVVLPAGQTDRDGILAAMWKYLVELPQRGDTVVFYDASHGSLRVNSKGSKLTVQVNGAAVHVDSTLVPADAYKGGFDVRDREMTRIFDAALDPVTRHARCRLTRAILRKRLRCWLMESRDPRQRSARRIRRWFFLQRNRSRRRRRFLRPTTQSRMEHLPQH
jgi:hypothetical protein